MTLDGTIIHKSGLITGGRSTHGSGRKWEEQEVQGTSDRASTIASRLPRPTSPGLRRQQETYIGRLRDLQKSKPRAQIEESLTAEMSRIESSLNVVKDDLVRVYVLSPGRIRLNARDFCRMHTPFVLRVSRRSSNMLPRRSLNLLRYMTRLLRL